MRSSWTKILAAAFLVATAALASAADRPVYRDGNIEVVLVTQPLPKEFAGAECRFRLAMVRSPHDGHQDQRDRWRDACGAAVEGVSRHDGSRGGRDQTVAAQGKLNADRHRGRRTRSWGRLTILTSM